MANETGPHLALATFCDTVREEKDGVLSAIRIIDRITQTAAGIEVPKEMPPFTQSLTLLVAFRAGEARGRYTVQVRPEIPNGFQLPPMDVAVHFEGEERGANLIMRFEFAFQLEGLYWFDVLFEEKLATRVPLRVMYQPQSVPQPPTS